MAMTSKPPGLVARGCEDYNPPHGQVTDCFGKHKSPSPHRGTDISVKTLECDTKSAKRSVGRHPLASDIRGYRSAGWASLPPDRDQSTVCRLYTHLERRTDRESFGDHGNALSGKPVSQPRS